MKSAERVALYSILVKLIFASIKISFAVISQSVALLAESIHAVTDLISTGLVFLGLKISAHKSKTFPYGLYKVENFVAAQAPANRVNPNPKRGVAWPGTLTRLTARYRRHNGSVGAVDSPFDRLRPFTCGWGRLPWAAQRWIGPFSRGVMTPASTQS